MNLPVFIKNRVSKGVLLAGRTTLGIGGAAAAWIEPRNSAELSGILKALGPDRPFLVVGAGSNLLFGDGCQEKVFIHLKAPEFNKVIVQSKTVKAGAGVRIGRLISFLMARDLGGYEFLAGIPGTIGGALAMNAGARSRWNDPSSYREMKDIALSVDVMDRMGRRLTLQRKEIVFSYRCSSLKSYVILGAELGLKRADRKAVGSVIKAAILKRAQVQDWSHPSAGSFFKNPEGGVPAAILIDCCGLKGFKVGGARVSLKHANFIINNGRASCSDVLKLMEIIRKKVYNRFRIKLEPEVEIVL